MFYSDSWLNYNIFIHLGVEIADIYSWELNETVEKEW